MLIITRFKHTNILDYMLVFVAKMLVLEPQFVAKMLVLVAKMLANFAVTN